mgnify:CR=1 FL=1
MKLPDANHPIWPILRVTTATLVLLFALWAFYNKLTPSDAKTMLLAIMVDAGMTSWASLTKKE